MTDYTEIAKKLYPLTDDGYTEFYEYAPIVNYLGTPVFQDGWGEWQGDAFIVIRKDSRWGFICIGYGSCTGCDALQGCHTHEELGELISNIERSVHWTDTKDQLVEWLYSDSRSLEWYGNDYEFDTMREIFKSSDLS